MRVGKTQACLLEGQLQLRFRRPMQAVTLTFEITDCAAGNMRLCGQVLLCPPEVAAGRATQCRRKKRFVLGLIHALSDISAHETDLA